MKDKILDIVAEHCVGWKNCEALTEKLFDLYSVSCQREQLKAQKLKDLRNWLQSDVKNIDSGIIKQKETELTRLKRKVLDKVKDIQSL